MADTKTIDPFICDEPAVEISQATGRMLKQLMKTADEGRVVPPQNPPANSAMAFKTLYHEDSLADLEEIFEWSREF